MKTDRELMQMSLEELEKEEHDYVPYKKVIKALRERLEQPEPEPVALRVVRGEICYKSDNDDNSYGMWCPVNYDTQHGFPNGTNFYTAPPSIEAAVLAEREACAEICENTYQGDDITRDWLEDAAAAIRKRGEK